MRNSETDKLKENNAIFTHYNFGSYSSLASSDIDMLTKIYDKLPADKHFIAKVNYSGEWMLIGYKYSDPQYFFCLCLHISGLRYAFRYGSTEMKLEQVWARQ